jgi:predicted dehydrogenase
VAKDKLVTRRGFLGRAGLFAAAPYVLTSGALGAPAASDRLVVGVIGTGGQGMSHVGQVRGNPRFRIAAVCDVDGGRLKRAKDAAGDCQATKDFREIIDRTDIDAVTTATPDHWHAPITILACQAGKDVYCEKPLSRTIAEGRAMVNAARRHGRIVQMGTQYRSIAGVRQFCEWIRNGRIGPIQRVRVWHAVNPVVAPVAPSAPPADLDYDLWLGPAPWAPYAPQRCHFSFRFFMDYAGGFICDNGAHMFSVISWALGTDATGPTTIEGTARWAPNNLYDVPAEMSVRYEFTDPPLTMTWEQPGEGGLSMQLIGTRGTFTGFFGPTLTQGEADLSPTRSSEIQLARSDNHFGNWLDCIATRRRPVGDVEIGHRVCSWSHLGNIACIVGRKLRWDPVAERFPDDEEANRLLARPFREPWSLPT